MRGWLIMALSSQGRMKKEIHWQTSSYRKSESCAMVCSCPEMASCEEDGPANALNEFNKFGFHFFSPFVLPSSSSSSSGRQSPDIKLVWTLRYCHKDSIPTVWFLKQRRRYRDLYSLRRSCPIPHFPPCRDIWSSKSFKGPLYLLSSYMNPTLPTLAFI